MFGEFYNLKVKDFRSKYGKSIENPNGLDEHKIYELAKLSTTKNNGKFNWIWDNQWSNISFNLNINRPYDDCSVFIFDTSINCGEDVYYVSKPDSFGKEDVQIKKNIPYQQTKKDGTIIEQPKPDDVIISKDSKQVWMQGVYAPYGDIMLSWKPDDVIIPNYTDTSKSLCPYSVNIPNNDGEYVPSLFERGMEILKEYSLTKLKRKQIIAALVPDGIRIDVESARNLDLGNGDSIAWEEVMRIYNQTGHEVWSSKGVDPLRPETPPLSNTVQRNSVQKVIELSNVMAGQILELRQVWGVPQYRDGSDVGDRTSGTLQQQQNESSYNVTDYILNGHNQVWEETFYKVCLLHWNDIVKEEPESQDDLLNTRFDVSVKMKATAYEKTLLEDDIKRYSQMPDAQNNPSLSPKDAMMLRNIDDYKMAVWYLTKTYEENRKKAIQQSQMLQQQNAKEQADVASENADRAEGLQKQKMDDEKDMLDYKTGKEKELALLNGIMMIASKGLTVPKEWQSVVQLLVPNISIPLAVENDDMEKGMKAKAMEDSIEQQQDAQMQAQGQQPIQGQQPPTNGQPQPTQQLPPQQNQAA